MKFVATPDNPPVVLIVEAVIVVKFPVLAVVAPTVPLWAPLNAPLCVPLCVPVNVAAVITVVELPIEVANTVAALTVPAKLPVPLTPRFALTVAFPTTFVFAEVSEIALALLTASVFKVPRLVILV